MKFKNIIPLLNIFIFFLGCFNFIYPNDHDKLNIELQSKMDEITHSGKIPGMTLSVVLPDKNKISLASGLADIEKKIKMKPSHRMLSGSIGKTYVATIILQLEEEKKLNINDPLKKYFKKEKWLHQLPNGENITIKMLLNHTSGIPEYVAKEHLWTNVKKIPNKTWKSIERLKYILGDPPIHEAGKGWHYADTNYILLGMLIEKITGNSYYKELKKRILKPLKLHQTTPSNKRKLKGLIPGYTRLKAPFHMNGKVINNSGQYIFNPQLEWTGGGLITTSLELALWAKSLYEGKVLSPKAQQKMLTLVETGEEIQYGLGVIAWNSDFGKSYGHSGFSPGYHSIMEYIPTYQFSIALQFNCDYDSEVLKKSRHQILSDFIKIVIHFFSKKHAALASY